VYFQDRDLAKLLDGENGRWVVAVPPQRFTIDAAGPAVIVTDGSSAFTKDVRLAIQADRLRLIHVAESEQDRSAGAGGLPIFGLLKRPVVGATLRSLIAAAFDNMSLAHRQAHLEKELTRMQLEIHELNEIGIALSTQRDRESLLNLILKKSREITCSDAGSLYLVEENEQGDHHLRFKITQNDSVHLPFTESTLAIDSSSIAGHVALTGEEVHVPDVYQMPISFPFGYNPRFDEESGYRCKSMLVVPMKNPQEDIIGVVQLINCKRDFDSRIDPKSVDEVVVPFPEQCRPLLRSLASQAAVAIDNMRLYENIEALFEGFVRASVSAIEARDPTTYGHSFRVADLTVGLAEAVDRDDSTDFRNVRFSRTEMKEIRYASLLHDFGKVGVREEILVKAKKFYPLQLNVVRQRFAYARKAMELEQSERKLGYLLEKGREGFLARQPEFQRELDEQLRELDEFLEFLVRCNEPTILREGNFEHLGAVASRYFVDSDGQRSPLLTSHEVKLLSISQGNLDEAERRQIESHVEHTRNFLRQIPWTKEIKNIPLIASAHHEKLDGTGYPNNLIASEIPLQSKMMTISDIFDALSATDRPYKRAVSQDQALDILFAEAKRGLIDAGLLRIFHEAEIFKLISNWRPS
jgi:HD-GYP domain-containing protein (c-di-GMP phosphodiesterase class II)